MDAEAEIQAKAAIAAALIQRGVVNLDSADLVGGDRRTNKQLRQLKEAVDNIFDTLAYRE
jgi:hypothetical protein